MKHDFHNPAGLTPEQVGEGYRLLLKSEVKLYLEDNEMQYWKGTSWSGKNCCGDNFNLTYRVPLSTWPLPEEPQWTPWNGGECPVKLKHSEVVEVKYRNMYLTKLQYPELQPWMHFGCEGDIIAYRVINHQSINQSKPVQPKLTAACAVERIDLNAFEFDDMPFPGRTLGRENKYSKTLKDMPVNKRLKVPIGDAAVVKHGMSRVLKATRPGHILRAIDDCGDGMGGVWWLEGQRPVKKADAFDIVRKK